MEKKKTNTKKRKLNAKGWRKISIIVLVVQALFELIAFVTAAKTGMLPMKYMVALGLILVLLLFLEGQLLLYKYTKTKNKNTGKVRRTAGFVLAGITTLICLYVSLFLGKVNSTLDEMTSDTVTISEIAGVYVLIDDPAQDIKDAADYTFAYTLSSGKETTLETIDAINDEVKGEVETVEYASIPEMVDALRAGEVQAMIMDETYEAVLNDTEGYEEFSTTVRIIFEHTRSYTQEKEDSNLDVTKDCFAVYISGSDTRSAKLAKSRSDVNILAFVNPNTKQILLLNTPRDYYVDISIASGQKDKLTHCGLYGVDCSMDTLAGLYGLDDINFYVQMNFEGFKKLIDELGGVTVVSEESFTSIHDANYSYVKGENYVDGQAALYFVRERYHLSGGDLTRGRHQMALISAVVDKVTGSTKLLTNYGGIMDSLEGMFSTDVGQEDISGLVNMQLSDGGKWTIKSFAVDGEGSSSTTYSMPKQKSYVMIPNETKIAKAKELIQKVYDGEVITDADLQME